MWMDVLLREFDKYAGFELVTFTPAVVCASRCDWQSAFPNPQPPTTSGKFTQPVANAIKLLQACIYKSVNTASLVATSIVKFMLFMLDS